MFLLLLILAEQICLQIQRFEVSADRKGMFVIESAIVHAAEELGVSPIEIQRKNLIEDGDEFPYGQIAESDAITSWTQADEEFDFAKLQSEADEFNKTSKYLKKGVAMMPICFGISFTKTPMNQARSLGSRLHRWKRCDFDRCG